MTPSRRAEVKTCATKVAYNPIHHELSALACALRFTKPTVLAERVSPSIFIELLLVSMLGCFTIVPGNDFLEGLRGMILNVKRTLRSIQITASCSYRPRFSSRHAGWLQANHTIQQNCNRVRSTRPDNRVAHVEVRRAAAFCTEGCASRQPAHIMVEPAIHLINMSFQKPKRG